MSDETRKSYEVLTPVIWGGEARKPGEVIFLNDEESKSYGAEHVRALAPEPAKAEATPEQSDAEGTVEVKPKKTRKAKTK